MCNNSYKISYCTVRLAGSVYCGICTSLPLKSYKLGTKMIVEYSLEENNSDHFTPLTGNKFRSFYLAEVLKLFNIIFNLFNSSSHNDIFIYFTCSNEVLFLYLTCITTAVFSFSLRFQSVF